MAPFQRTTVPAHWRDPNYRTGRPTDYRPEYCDMVIEDMRQGYSLTAFAGKIGVSRDAVYSWIRAHAAFADAVHRATPGRQRRYEAKLLTADKGGEVAAAIFGLKNCAPEDWKEVRNVKHDHEHKLATLTDAELYAIASQRQSGSGPIIDGDAVRTGEK